MKQLRDQLSTHLVSVFIVLAFGGTLIFNLWGILTIREEQQKLANLVHRADHAIQLGMRAQLDFNVQVQEWKNVLLRGTRPDFYEKYYGDFEERERITRDTLEELKNRLRVDLGAESIARLTEELIADHVHLASEYRAALALYDRTDTTSYLRVDNIVRSIDRAPRRKMDQLVGLIEEATAEIVNTASLRESSIARRVVLLCSGATLFGLAVAVFFVYERFRKEAILLKSRKQAEQASRAKDEFLANMSHEIRTPMNAIVGMSEMLRESPLTQEQEELVSIIQRSGNALLEIINEILDLSRIEAGKFTIDPIEIDLLDTVYASLEVVAPSAARLGLELALQVEDSFPLRAVTDGHRIKQILINLLSNAVKFTEKGTITARCGSRRLDDGRLVIWFSVEDSGIGISQEDQALLFQNFSQVDNSNRRRFEGTGLGLSICRKICKLMDGDIKLTSQPDQGSTFEFWITPQSLSHRLCDESKRFDERYPHQRFAILDEEFINPRELKRWLEFCGFEVVHYRGIQEVRQGLARNADWDYSSSVDPPRRRPAAKSSNSCANTIRVSLAASSTVSPSAVRLFL